MNKSFYSEYLDRLEIKRSEYQERVSSGSCRSFEDYKGLCGRIQGLEDAENVLKELYKTLHNDNENISKGVRNVESDFT